MSDLQSKVVLVIDDELEVRTAVGEMIRRSGYQVLEAESAESAFEVLASAHIDLVLTDLMMPGMNGWQLLDRIRERDARTKVVVFTGYIDDQGAAILQDRKADGFLVKPVKLKKLQDTLSALLPEEQPPEDSTIGGVVIAVDDDPVTLRFVEAALFPHSIMLQTFTDPDEALLAAERDPPHLFLLDLNLPTISGLDLYRKMNEIDSLVGIPVIIMTAQSDRATVLEAIEFGIASFVVKPFDTDDLAAKVTKVLAQMSLN